MSRSIVCARNSGREVASLQTGNGRFELFSVKEDTIPYHALEIYVPYFAGLHELVEYALVKALRVDGAAFECEAVYLRHKTCYSMSDCPCGKCELG